MRRNNSYLLLTVLASSLACDEGAAGAGADCPDGQVLCKSVCQTYCLPTASTGGAAGKPITIAAASSPLTSPDCTDTATLSGSLPQQYGGVNIPTASGNKSYFLHTNWWHEGTFSGQTVDYQGLSFVVGNPNAKTTPDNSPMGYPSLFIGTYAGHATTGSNLPKLVSSLSAVPTVLSTNAASIDYSHHNAAYDVWFTDTAAPLSAGAYSPPPGGAFLMVWLFMPTNRQPRGSIRRSAVSITGVEGKWDVWVDPSSPPCISYVSTTTKNDLAFDLNTFIKDSVTNKHGITDSMYLSVVFAGFEVWGGGDGVAIRNFCADVK